MRDYPTVVEVLAIQDDQIERYGGAAGVRDPGLLEAALFRPQTGYYANLVEETAALWESLSFSILVLTWYRQRRRAPASLFSKVRLVRRAGSMTFCT